jgi:hypothetical protein
MMHNDDARAHTGDKSRMNKTPSLSQICAKFSEHSLRALLKHPTHRTVLINRSLLAAVSPLRYEWW